MKKILLIVALASLWACEKAEVAPSPIPEAPKYYTVKGERVANTQLVNDTVHGRHEFSFFVWMCHDTTTFDPSSAAVDTMYGLVEFPINMDLRIS